MIRSAVLVLGAALLLGCGGGKDESVTGVTPVRVSVAGSQSDLVVHRYFLPFAHGPTQFFRVWADAGVVLQLRATDDSGGLAITARYLRFTGTDQKTQIERWINNQHSDALFSDVQTPSEFAVGVTVSARDKTGTDKGSVGDVYDVYAVTAEVAALDSPMLATQALSIQIPVYKRLAP